MKKVRFFLLMLASALAGVFSLSAQLTLREGSFRLRPNDTEILINRNSPKERVKITDDNGKLCSLIKIYTENMTEADRKVFIKPSYRETDRATFITKIETDHVNEIWIFLSPGASYMVLKHPDYGNCKFDFTAMGVTLLSGKVYEATITGDRKVYESILARDAKASTGDEDKYQYLVITASPSNAEIYINGEFSGTGEASKRLPMGMRHAYRVEAPMYHSQEGTLEISERTSLPITLKPAFGYVSVFSVPESGAEVYVDNELLGVTPLESDKRLVSGEHTLRVSKRDFRPVEQKITITDDTRIPVNIDMLATFANLSITAGEGVAIYIDGEKAG
ncbi:MAG: PEGA domain-containing protein, partial [Bacteroidales bacterium]|nr:PEGA domain-containing protein [Bacteroidales bacterium]